MGILRRGKGGGGGVYKDIIPPENKSLAWVDMSVPGVPLVKIWNEEQQDWMATGSTTTAVGQANLISFDATGTSYTSGNVEGALKEVSTQLGAKATSAALTAHTSDTTIHITGTERTNWNSKAAGNHTHAELHTHANKSLLDKVTYTGAKTSIDLKSIEDNTTALASKANVTHDHNTLYNTKVEVTTILSNYVKKDVSGKVIADSVDWANVANKPSTFTPSTHTHATTDVTGLPTILANKVDKTSVEDMFNTLSTLQSTIADLQARVADLEGKAQQGPAIEWSYDFIVPASTGSIILTNDAAWTHTLTAEDIYGPAFDGVGAKAELRMLGVQDGTKDEPGQVLPRDGVDAFAAPSIHGSYVWDADVHQIIFSSMALNPYYFRIVKYV